MFQGEAAVTVDDKGRVAIPAAFRSLLPELCGNRLMVTYDPFEHGCLWIFPYPEWEKVRDSVNALPKHRAVHRDLQRKVVGAATPVEPDGNGRIALPASLRGSVGLEKRAVLLGMDNKLELWAEQAHLAKIRQTIGEGDITEEMAGLQL